MEETATLADFSPFVNAFCGQRTRHFQTSLLLVNDGIEREKDGTCRK